MTSAETLTILEDLVKEFVEMNSGFIGLKVIYAANRNGNVMAIREDFEEFKKLQ